MTDEVELTQEEEEELLRRIEEVEEGEAELISMEEVEERLDIHDSSD